LKKKFVLKKTYDIKFGKLGDVLVKAGLITEAELRRALEVQEASQFSNGHRSLLGEVVTDLFKIPPEIIENIFIRQYLMSAVQEAFLSALLNDHLLNLHLEKHHIAPNSLIKKIETKVPFWEVDKCYRFRDADGGTLLEHSTIKSIAGDFVFRITMEDDQEFKQTASFSYKTALRKIDLDMPGLISTARLELLQRALGTMISLEHTAIEYSEIFLDLQNLCDKSPDPI